MKTCAFDGGRCAGAPGAGPRDEGDGRLRGGSGEAETVAAIATPFGEGAIAVVRITGPRAVAVADVVTGGAAGKAEVRRAVRAAFWDAGGEFDDGLVTVFRGPASYTGEDVVEMSGHGGVLAAGRLLRAVLGAGAEMAGPGEFTRRAFLNGKMDLTQAEAVMDVIRARTDLALRAAREQLEGRLGGAVRALQDELLGALAHVEAYIDFPEEDIGPETGAALEARIGAVAEGVEGLVRTAERGRILREGWPVVLVGAPNAGKSSLLNALLGRDRAIVSATPGTTRDTLEEMLDIRGVPVRVVDTAGLRDAPDPVEAEGVARTRAAMEGAALVLRVCDVSEPAAGLPGVGASDLVLANKCDLPEHPSWAGVDALRVSARTGKGLEALESAIADRAWSGGAGAGVGMMAINVRHRALLERAVAALVEAREGLAAARPPELVAEALRAGLDALGEIVGRTDVEDLLGRIFSTFCIGK